MDIESRKDIVGVLDAFYSKVFSDPVIGYFFTEVVPLDLEKHIPLIADFWESVVLQTRPYGRNLLQIHRNIHELSPIRKQHLDRWVALFTQTVEERYEGPNASLMIQRARSIATILQMKLTGES